MEINESTILDDRGFVKINGDEAKSFLQNIVTNDIEKITDSLTLFSSIFLLKYLSQKSIILEFAVFEPFGLHLGCFIMQ